MLQSYNFSCHLKYFPMQHNINDDRKYIQYGSVFNMVETYKDNAIENNHHHFKESKTSHFSVDCSSYSGQKETMKKTLFNIV